MSKSEFEQISGVRRILENPYAHIERLEALQNERYGVKRGPSRDLISSSRELLQNPYAYLDGQGTYSANARVIAGSTAISAPNEDRQVAQPISLKVSAGGLPQLTYSDLDIEIKVREIHEGLWSKRDAIWGDDLPADPIEMLDPAIALGLAGFDFQLAEGLGQYRDDGGGLVEVAGVIDRDSQIVLVSTQFPLAVRMFTAAHELGHAALHQTATGVHRDRSLDGASFARDRTEREADKFASLFLMPAKLVRSRFEANFGKGQFALSDETSFALTGCSYPELRSRCWSHRDISRLLAGAEFFNGQRFPSLATQFRVSTEAMAIRLEELALVAA